MTDFFFYNLNWNIQNQKISVCKKFFQKGSLYTEHTNYFDGEKYSKQYCEIYSYNLK